MKVEFTYFKPTGKYYTSGIIEMSDDLAFFEVCREAEDLRAFRKLPGLVSGWWPAPILVEVKEASNEMVVGMVRLLV